MTTKQKLYRVTSGELETVTLEREHILEGATLPSITIRYKDGRKAYASMNMFELTELAAWKRWQKELKDLFPTLENAVKVAKKSLKECVSLHFDSETKIRQLEKDIVSENS